MGREETEARADARLEAALEEHALRDPREFYRARLRDLKDRDADAFERALRYYREELVPRVADEASDPLAEWAAYGQRLGELTGAGRTVAVDPGGRARPWEPEPSGRPSSPESDHVILHLPDEERVPALVVAAPREPSPAQRAMLELLVS